MKLPGIRLITQSQLGRFFQNVTTINFRDWFFSFQPYASRCWAKRTWIHVLWDTLLFVRYSPFYLYLFLFSFAFLSPSSIYFGVLSNFLARFSRLALHLAFFGRSVSFFPAIFTQNPLSTNLKYNNFPLLTKL